MSGFDSWSVSTHTLLIDHGQYCNGWTPFQQIQLFHNMCTYRLYMHA